MTVFWMKLIAMVSMVTDHTAVFLYPQFIDKSLYEALRAVGRLAFPIYAYLIVNGYQKTSSVKRYLTRLAAFALVSQVPWVLAADFTYLPNDSGLMVSLGSRWFVCLIFILVACVGWYCTVRADWSTAILGLALLAAVLRVEYAGIRILSDSLNVFYTLALGLALIALLDAAMRPGRDVIRLSMQALALFGAFFLIQDNADYRSLGAALIVAIWLARESRWSQAGVIALWCVAEYIIDPLPHPISHFIAAMLSLVPILLYNGRQGKPLKLAFYTVYPLHLAILGMATVFLALTGVMGS